MWRPRWPESWWASWSGCWDSSWQPRCITGETWQGVTVILLF
jgi:hypothetical protein